MDKLEGARVFSTKTVYVKKDQKDQKCHIDHENQVSYEDCMKNY